MAKVLIVDDDVNNRYLLSTLLLHAGHTVLEAKSGEEALASVAQQPDLIVVDLNLPDMPGVEVIRRLRSNEGTVHAKIALYTATNSPAAIEEVLQTFALQGVIPKPADPKQILAAFKRILSAA